MNCRKGEAFPHIERQSRFGAERWPHNDASGFKPKSLGSSTNSA